MSNRQNFARRGLMFVLSSPSGAGKTALSRRLLEDEAELTLSVSVTTRPPRPGEVDGVDYHFISTEDFSIMRNKQELLESAKVFDNYYGTPRAEVETALSAGRDVLFDIDWQGAQQLAQKMRDDLVKVFILPPSTQELEQRLQKRAQDPPEVVASRMAKAGTEISHWAEYDYIIINDDFDAAYQEIRAILHAERLKRDRREGLLDFVDGLTAGL